MPFGFGSPPSDSGAIVIPPAINLTSWDDMCVERGGITGVILIAILVFYLAAHYHILISEGSYLKTVTSPLYDHDKPNQSKFRRFMLTLEKMFVLPFVPKEVDSMVMWMFMWFIAITIPMAVTRYYDSRWAHDLITLQGPLNLISYYVFGCESFNLTAIPYSEVVDEAPPRYPPPPKEDKWGRMDYFFSYHLGIGIIWLFVGFIQIYKAQEGGWSLTPKTNWKAHRAFGRVAIVIVCAHICMMAIMTNENPVNQHPIILFGYCGMIFRSVRHVYLGVKYARQAAKTSPRRVPNQTAEQRNEHRFNRRKHEMYMFYVYARTTVGSGTIRVAAWALWLVGQYLKPETRVIIDRGACQTYAEQGIGDATDCWKPVYINLMFTDLNVLWMEVLFITMENRLADLVPASRKLLEAEKTKKRSALEQQVILTFPSIFLCLYDPDVERWIQTSNLPYFLGFILENLAEFSAILWYIIVHFSDEIRDFLEDHVYDPIDRFYMSTVKSYIKTFYILDEDEDEHVKEE